MPPASAEPTRSAILQAATELFLERGVAATSLSEIAKRASVTKSLILHHFDTKEKLWAAVKDRLMSEYCELQAQMLQGRELDLSLFLQSMETYFDFLARRPEFTPLVTMFCLESLRDARPVGEQFADSMGTELFALGVGIIERAQAAGAIRADLSAGFILSTCLGMAESWFLRRNWTMHCVADVPPQSDRANTWFRHQMTLFIERALAPVPR